MKAIGTVQDGCEQDAHRAVQNVTFGFHDACDGLPKRFEKAHSVFASVAHDLDEGEAKTVLKALPMRVQYEAGRYKANMLVEGEHGLYAMAAIVRHLSDRFVGRWDDKRILIAKAFGTAILGPMPVHDESWKAPSVGEYVIYSLYRRWHDTGTETAVLEAELQTFSDTLDPEHAPSFFSVEELAGLPLDHKARSREDYRRSLDDVATSIRTELMQRSIEHATKYWSIKKRLVVRVVSAADAGHMAQVPHSHTDALAFVLAVAASAAFSCELVYDGRNGDQAALLGAFACNQWFTRMQNGIRFVHSIEKCIPPKAASASHVYQRDWRDW